MIRELQGFRDRGEKLLSSLSGGDSGCRTLREREEQTKKRSIGHSLYILNGKAFRMRRINPVDLMYYFWVSIFCIDFRNWNVNRTAVNVTAMISAAGSAM